MILCLTKRAASAQSSIDYCVQPMGMRLVHTAARTSLHYRAGWRLTLRMMTSELHSEETYRRLISWPDARSPARTGTTFTGVKRWITSATGLTTGKSRYNSPYRFSAAASPNRRCVKVSISGRSHARAKWSSASASHRSVLIRSPGLRVGAQPTLCREADSITFTNRIRQNGGGHDV